MEAPTIDISIENLSISEFDEISIRQIILHFFCESVEFTLQYPYSYTNLPSKNFLNNDIEFHFSYKSKIFGKSRINIPEKIEDFSQVFEINPINESPLSPEKQRPDIDESKKDSKTLGKGELKIKIPKFVLKKEEYYEFDHQLSNLALDLSTIIRENGQISEKQVENLRVLLIGLNTKLKNLCLMQDRLTFAESLNNSHLIARELVQNSMQGTCKTFEGLKSQLLCDFQNFSREKNEIQQAFNNLLVQFREKCEIEIALKSTLKVKESEIAQLKNEIKNFDDMQKMIDDLKAHIKDLESDRDTFRLNFFKTIDLFQQNITEKDCEIRDLQAQNSKLEETITGKNSIIHGLENLVNEKLSRINVLTSQKKALKGIVKGIKDLENKSLAMEKLANSHQIECVQIQNFLKATCAEFNSNLQSLDLEKKDFLEKLSVSLKETTKVKQDLHEKSGLYKAETINCQDLRSKLVIIQQKLSNTIDISKLFQQIKFLSTFSTEIRDKLQEDNEEITMLYVNRSYDCLSLSRSIVQINDLIEDRDNEISILRDLIADLQNKMNYYPIKDDPVDEAIAEYVNSRNEPMPIQFIREEYGIYLFGTKRVFIKLENNKIISKIYVVRVGGGFMRIDEFVNTYTPIEVEKINERKVERNKPKRKELMSRVLDGIGMF